MLAPGAILQAMLQGVLQGAGLVGSYLKALKGVLLVGSRFWLFVIGCFVPGVFLPSVRVLGIVLPRRCAFWAYPYWEC